MNYQAQKQTSEQNQFSMDLSGYHSSSQYNVMHEACVGLVTNTSTQTYMRPLK
eukprot:Pgem_evm1s16485